MASLGRNNVTAVLEKLFRINQTKNAIVAKISSIKVFSALAVFCYQFLVGNVLLYLGGL